MAGLGDTYYKTRSVINGSAAYDEKRTKISWLTLLMEPGCVTPETLAHEYKGSGLEDDPYLVTFLDSDTGDPRQFSPWIRWTMCIVAANLTFSVAFISSAYTSGVPGIVKEFGGSPDVATLGLSLFLLGFVLGPFVWGPTSENIGRQPVMIISGITHVIFNVAICFCGNLGTLLVLRLLSGAFGSAPLTNSAGVITDIFPPKERGLAITVYAIVPLFAPVLGTIIGEFIAGTLGWRWLMGVMALVSAFALTAAVLLLPETYQPVLLHKRAQRLGNMMCFAYASAMASKDYTRSSFGRTLVTTLWRPFVLAIHEPIILAIAIYQAIVFGTLYMTFAAFPIAYTEIRGWPQEHSGLSFIGILVGIFLSVFFQFWDNQRYVRLVEKLRGESAEAESRLLGTCVGGVSLVIGIFWFASTTNPKVHWIINVTAGIPFGFGVVLVTISSTNYLIDSYTSLVASAITVCIVTRAICGAAFPLFVRTLFAKLGVFWTLAIPASMALVCVPLPFVLYRYGSGFRSQHIDAYARQSDQVLRQEESVADERTRLLSG